MGKASRTKTDIHRRDRIAAQRAAQRRHERRQRLFMAGGSIIVVIAVVVGFVVWKTSSSNSSNNAGGASNGPTGAALTAVVKDVTGVPASTLDKVAGGGSTLQGAIKSVSGTALTQNGKPEVFYDGAEYCPFCAANRWGMIVALNRFGTFTGLKTIHSSTVDSPSNVPTWTFYGSTYTSQYINFTSVEETTNVPVTAGSSANGYTALQTPTSDEKALITKYDGANGSIPFVDFGNKYVQVGDLPMLEPTSLKGDWATIASDLANPSSANAKAVDGAANFMTAAICKLTGNQPASACTSTIQGLESQL